MPKQCPKGLRRRVRRPKRFPRDPQEAPKSTPGGSKRASRDPKSRAGLKTLQETPRGSKRQRRLWRSPKTTYPIGLAPNRRKKKGGRAAVIPLGEVNPPPDPEGRRWRRVRLEETSAQALVVDDFWSSVLPILACLVIIGQVMATSCRRSRQISISSRPRHIIAFPYGGTPPPARKLSACPVVNSRQGVLARHL